MQANLSWHHEHTLQMTKLFWHTLRKQHNTVYPFKADSGVGREEGSHEDQVKQGIKQMHLGYQLSLWKNTHTHTMKQASQATGLKTSKLVLSKYVWILLLVIKKMNVFANRIIYGFFWKVVTNWLLKIANHWISCLLPEGNNNVK